MASKYASKETTNFARICTVMVGVVPDLLRHLLDTLLPGDELKKKIKDTEFKRLYKSQKEILYPPGGFQGSVKDFDVTLLCLLMRNFGVVKPEHRKGWGNYPDRDDRTVSANIDRLREQRNEAFAHARTTFVSDKDFEEVWSIVRQSVDEIQDGLPKKTFVKDMDEIHDMKMDHTASESFIKKFLGEFQSWQFYLDYLASNVSANISRMSSVLGVAPGKFEEINRRWKSNPHELCFNVLWKWYEMSTDNKKRLEEMSMALEATGREDLAKKLMEGKFPVPVEYAYHGEIKDPDAEVTLGDAFKVRKYLTLTFQSLARYFGLDENDIQRICIDHNDDIQEQIYQTVKECIQRRKLMTRRQLCDGLAYLENNKAVLELNEAW